MARWRRRSFLAGIVALAVALLSPLDAMSGSLASAHMVQHLLLTTVAAPLLVLGVRWRVLIAGLPPGVRRRTSRWRTSSAARAGRAVLAHPVVGEPPVRRRVVGVARRGPVRGGARRPATCTASSTPASWPLPCCRGRRSSPRRVAGPCAGHGGTRPVRACDGERPARRAADVRPDAVVSGLRRHDGGLGPHAARGSAAGRRRHVGARTAARTSWRPSSWWACWCVRRWPDRF